MDIFTIEEITVLRKYINMSVKKFWSILDLTKQTGYNLEEGKTPVSKVNLIAATSVLKNLYFMAEIDPYEVLAEYRKIKDSDVFKKLTN